MSRTGVPVFGFGSSRGQNFELHLAGVGTDACHQPAFFRVEPRVYVGSQYINAGIYVGPGRGNTCRHVPNRPAPCEMNKAPLATTEYQSDHGLRGETVSDANGRILSAMPMRRAKAMVMHHKTTKEPSIRPISIVVGLLPLSSVATAAAPQHSGFLDD